MVRKTTLAAVLGVAALLLAACDTMDDESGQSDAQRAYDACQPYHQDKRQSLGKSWAFVSGVNGDGSSSCRWSFNYPNAAAAAKAAFDACRTLYSRCFVFATSDGLSDWVRTMSDNIGAGRDPNYGLPGYAQNSGGGERHRVTLSHAGDSNDDSDSNDRESSDDNGSGDDGPSIGTIIQGITAGIVGGTKVIEAVRGGGGGTDFGPVGVGVSTGGGGCRPDVGQHIFMPYEQDPNCHQPNAQGSGTPAGTNRSTITGH